MARPPFTPTHALCLSLFSLTATAQTTAPNTANNYSPVEVVNTPLEYRQFEKVEITGSSIVRKEQTQALPVQVMTRDDIRRSGLKPSPKWCRPCR